MDGRLMLVDADGPRREALAQAMRSHGWEVVACATADDALDQLFVAPDVVLVDTELPDTGGLALCDALIERRPGLPVVVLAADGDMDKVLGALRVGATDFLAGPPDPDLIEHTLSRVVENRRMRQELRRLRRRVRQRAEPTELVGDSPAIRRLRRLVERVAQAPSSVLITGESGTGKELVARAVHAGSARKDGPFIALNCAAMPDALLESELFGHVRGAFTDARSDRAGLLAQARGGTLFLDEIGDLSAALQPKLLRVLEERKARPVGGDRSFDIDTRVVAATHQDLEHLVEQGRFRADLLYRLDVIRLEVPALRERGADVLLLAQRFTREYADRLSKDVFDIEDRAAARLLDYPWPGNVRELRNALERAVVMAEGAVITVDDLPPKLSRPRPAGQQVLAATDDVSAMLPMHEVERRYVVKVLEALGGNRTRASQVLEIDRKTLYRKLRSWGMEG